MINKLLTLIVLFIMPIYSFEQSIDSSYVKITNLVEGDDWWLPENIDISENSGFGSHWKNFETVIISKTWRELNPEENKYNWAPIISLLNKRKSFLIIKPASTGDVPTWVKNKYPNPIIQNNNMYPIFLDGPRQEYIKFIHEFGKSGIPKHDSLAFVYVVGLFPPHVEFSASTKTVKEMEQKLNFNSSMLLNTTRELLDAYAQAFGNYVGKAVFTAHDRSRAIWGKNGADYDKAVSLLIDHALNLGMAIRSGDTEFYDRYADVPHMGSTLDKNRYVVVDENYPLILDSRRAFTCENEEFSNHTPLIPEYACNYFYLKLAHLTALRLRVRWIRIGTPEVYNLSPEFHEWVRLELGKTFKNSPDAWVYLRETTSEDNNPGGARIQKNIERWLYQRDVPGGYTKPVFKKKAVNPAYSDNFEARSTNYLTNNNYIYFKVDENFISHNPQDIWLKITYLDDKSSGRWRIEYDSGTNTTQPSPWIQYTNSQKWKTVTFEIHKIYFQKRQPNGMDFRIYDGANQNVIVNFVRLIKKDHQLNHENEPNAQIILENTSPLKNGTFNILLKSNIDIIRVPTPLKLSLSDGSKLEIKLSGPVPGNSFTGKFVIDASIPDGIGIFSLPIGSLESATGASGNIIISGSQISINKNPPNVPRGIKLNR